MTDKYTNLFEFYVKLYDDEIARFRSLDAKIARYLSAHSILISLTGFVGVSLRFLLHDPRLISILVVANYLCLACIFVVYVMGFYYLTSALKVENLKRFNYDDSMIELFLSHRSVDIKYALVRRAKEAIEYNVIIGDKKSEKLARAIRWSFSWQTMLLLAVSVLLAMFNTYFASNIVLW